MRKRLISTAVAMAAAVPLFATEGINLIGIGPVQQGTAGAGVASAKDSSWLILNPAGLVDLQPSMDTSLQVFAPVRTIDSTMSFAGKQEDDSMFVIPTISTAFGCCQGENGFIGLGVYGTSGMGVDYSFGRVGGDSNSDGIPDMAQNMVDQMTELSVAKITATYAYRFGDSGLSVGVGPILVISRFRTDMLDATFTPSSGKWDTAYGFGGIFGVNQHLGRLSLGASYMSEQKMSDFDGYASLFNDALDLPQQLTVGAAYNVLDNLELVLDYRWIGWGELNTMGDQFGWENQHIIKAGVTWGVSDALTLRSGISYGKSPINEGSAFGNALFPAIMETHFTCGASYTWETWSAHVAYIHAFEESITANGDDMGPMGGMAAGTEISMYQNSLTLGVTHCF